MRFAAPTLAVLLLLAGSPTGAQTPPAPPAPPTAPAAPPPAPPAAPPPPPCTAPEHRQFDFWLGEWQVEARGSVAGENRITRLYGDCGLREEYRTANGAYVGTSFNLWDASRRLWHQTWVDNQGLLLLLDGRFEKGSMRLEGRTPIAGGEQIDRITWTPNPDGTVRQLWEQSRDGGATWTTAFDGLYRRKA